MKIVYVVGARPNFVKIAPLMAAVTERTDAERRAGRAGADQVLVHTGQHYDRRMSELFFEQLSIPRPDVNLGVGSGSHAQQTAQIMTRFEEVCLAEKPTHLVVVGDVNSTLAGALVAVKLGIRVVHVEGGLRSGDRRMPEEINRIMTDSISDVLFVTERSAVRNLRREGIPPGKIHLVGNVMIDSLLAHRARAEQSGILRDLGLETTDGTIVPYDVVTLHRAETVDDRGSLSGVMEALVKIARSRRVVFPIHPRTRQRIGSYGLDSGGLQMIDPLGYLEFMKLMSHAGVVLTDSGGIQEESTILRVPCVTIRDSTERPVTVTNGTNMLAGTSPKAILRCHQAQSRPRRGHARGVPPLWDGHAATRIASILLGAG